MTIDIERRFSIEQFEAGEIDAEQFNHLAHVYVAWLYVNRFGPDTALPRFDAALRRLTERLGVPEKYHATITGFLLTLIAERINNQENWRSFCAGNHDLLGNSRSLLASYYSEARLNSSEARRNFVLPDNPTV